MVLRLILMENRPEGLIRQVRRRRRDVWFLVGFVEEAFISQIPFFKGFMLFLTSNMPHPVVRGKSLILVSQIDPVHIKGFH
jgi:hypothetical protein